MKNKLTLILIATLLINSCTAFKKLDVSTSDQVYKLTKYKYDNYSKDESFKSPDLSIGVYSGVPGENNDYFLIALKEPKKWQYVILVHHYARDWKFLDTAFLKGFKKIQMRSMDRIVRHGGNVAESIMIPLTDKMLKYCLVNGIDLKLLGSRGSTIINISTEQLKGFVKKVNNEPLEYDSKRKKNPLAETSREK